MLSFENDYAEGAHPKVLQRLADTNLIQQPGYGEDEYSRSAKEKIRAACRCPAAEIFLLSGGTQANLTVISALLRPTEGVVSAATGHIACHEAGAIEASGHKVIPLPEYHGKIRAEDLASLLDDFYADPTHPHMVSPGMVYLSHPTEYGTLYTKAELAEIARVCGAYEIPLYLDGARLGYGLESPGADVTLPFLCEVCSAFTIGGTKVGALCGEAAVFPRGAPKGFFTHIKQRGALAAKGRLLGAQFDALFTDGLYFDISRHAIRMAEELKRGLQARGYRLFLDSPTNQQFVVLDMEEMAQLQKRVRFSYWGKLDENRAVVRFAVSWATAPEQIARLMEILDETKKARENA